MNSALWKKKTTLSHRVTVDHQDQIIHATDATGSRSYCMVCVCVCVCVWCLWNTIRAAGHSERVAVQRSMKAIHRGHRDLMNKWWPKQQQLIPGAGEGRGAQTLMSLRRDIVCVPPPPPHTHIYEAKNSNVCNGAVWIIFFFSSSYSEKESSLSLCWRGLCWRPRRIP